MNDGKLPATGYEEEFWLIANAITDKFAVVHWGLMIYRKRGTTEYVVQSVPAVAPGTVVEPLYKEFSDRDEAVRFLLSKMKEDEEE
jgi:hypothetical protein